MVYRYQVRVYGTLFRAFELSPRSTRPALLHSGMNAHGTTRTAPNLGQWTLATSRHSRLEQDPGKGEAATPPPSGWCEAQRRENEAATPEAQRRENGF